MMKSAMVATVLAIGALALGGGTATAAAVRAQDAWVGSYATYEACAADGASASTGGTVWQCVEVVGGWDLYTY